MALYEVFDFECNISGAAVIVVRTPLMPRCLSDGEIDANIRSLKQELDAVALKMKKAVREQAKKPDFPNASRT